MLSRLCPLYIPSALNKDLKASYKAQNCQVMSLMSAMDDVDKGRIPLLKTADQYPAWRVRVADKCWALTGKDIFQIKDNVCTQALQAQSREEKKEDNWVGKCWLIITGAIHDDLLMKVAHIERGKIESLLIEISAALVIYTAEEIQPLRL